MQFAILNLKPSNLFEDDDNECVITDFSPFSNENAELYLPPESIAALQKNQIQRFASDETNQLEGDPIKLDICNIKRFKSLSFCQSHQNKVNCKKVIWISFFESDRKNVERNPSMRSPINDLEYMIQDFLSDEIINHDKNLLQPNPDLLLDELKLRVTEQKSQTVVQYLSKYQMQSVSWKLKTTNFWQVLDDIKISISFQEKVALLQLYGIENNDKIDLSKWIQTLKEVIKLGKLSQVQNQELLEMLKELNQYLADININLIEILKENDQEQLGYLPFDKFENIITQQGMYLNLEDSSLLKLKYDPQKKNIIYYEHFYTRDRYNISISFFLNYDSKLKGYLQYDDIYKFLNENGYHPKPEVFKKLLYNLDQQNKKKITFENVRIFFEININQDLKKILTQLINGLHSVQMTLPQLIKSSINSSSVISQSQFYNTLKQTNNHLQQTDFQFLLNYFRVKDEIEYPHFIQALAVKARDLQICNWKYLQQVDGRVSFLEKDDFDDSELTFQELINFNPKSFNSQREFLQFITKKFQERDEIANSSFRCNQEIAKIVLSISQYMEKETCTLLDFYRQTDRDKDYCISNEEFTELLQSTIGYTSTQNIQKQLFEIFDMDSDGKINFTEFEYQVYKRNQITAKQIEEMKYVMLNGRNPYIEQLRSAKYDISKVNYIQFYGMSSQYNLKFFDQNQINMYFHLQFFQN
ncbi:unnamed protein product [Paramecium sonneborni]|uniref:EF-hand domain-containing protein n=1 Tax=Paramecium sonneborni TaxID=65129 RepID=A0A8S1PCS9_9CILI|nr:unnamed protein product [Paramecium sonneborni]